MKKISIILSIFSVFVLSAQTINTTILSYNEFLGYIKQNHPVVKQANLKINMAQANLMQARGNFDPKIEANYDQKEYQNKNYYSLLNSSFKIPTWYGIELKAAFDNSEGIYVNPQNVTGNNGLTSLGITMPLGQGLLINQRMADLKTAKIQVAISENEQKIAAISVLYNASIAYFNWVKTHNEYTLYADYVKNADKRFKGVQLLIKYGDKPKIDSVESGILLKSRKLKLIESEVKRNKARLEVSNYVWTEENIPLEIKETVNPETDIHQKIKAILRNNELLSDELKLDSHPKLNALQYKIDALTIEKRLKSNLLLPKIDIGYHYLSEPSVIDQFNFNDYKVGVNFSLPLFLRKERGGLKISKFKLQDAEYEFSVQKVQLTNKINGQKLEINALSRQKEIIDDLVTDFELMMTSEEKLFSFGESSLFILNLREEKLIKSKVDQISLENDYCQSHAILFKLMANPD